MSDLFNDSSISSAAVIAIISTRRFQAPSRPPLILGPSVCAVCADGYTTGAGYTCAKCTDGRRDATIAVISVVLLLAAVLAVAARIKYLQSESEQTLAGGSVARRGLARIRSRLKRSKGAQTLKIIVSYHGKSSLR